MLKRLQQHFFLLWFFLVLSPLGKIAVAGPSIYTIKISVDVTGTSAAEAKDGALEKAREDAFHKLLSRLSVLESVKEKPGFLKEDIPDYIKSFSIQQEERSSVRYRAIMEFNFDAYKLQSRLRENKITFSEPRTVQLVVLPILIKNDRFILWNEEENIWYKTWAALEEEGESVRIICPLADLEDQALVPISSLSDLKKATLVQLKERYKTEDVLIAVLSLDGEDAASSQKGYIRFVPFALQEHQNTETIGPFVIEKETDLMSQRCLVTDKLQALWKERTSARQEQNGIIKIQMKIETPAMWKQSLKKIQNLPMVQSTIIHSFSKTEAVLWVNFRGTLGQFQEKLVYEGFVVGGDHSLMQLKR